jgi:DNA repair protein RadA/Sms
VNGLARRLREAARLGFTRAIVPARQARADPLDAVTGIEVIRVATVREAIAAALVEMPRATRDNVRIPIVEAAS